MDIPPCPHPCANRLSHAKPTRAKRTLGSLGASGPPWWMATAGPWNGHTI